MLRKNELVSEVKNILWNNFDSNDTKAWQINTCAEEIVERILTLIK